MSGAQKGRPITPHARGQLRVYREQTLAQTMAYERKVILGDLLGALKDRMPRGEPSQWLIADTSRRLEAAASQCGTFQHYIGPEPMGKDAVAFGPVMAARSETRGKGWGSDPDADDGWQASVTLAWSRVSIDAERRMLMFHCQQRVVLLDHAIARWMDRSEVFSPAAAIRDGAGIDRWARVCAPEQWAEKLLPTPAPKILVPSQHGHWRGHITRNRLPDEQRPLLWHNRKRAWGLMDDGDPVNLVITPMARTWISDNETNDERLLDLLAILRRIGPDHKEARAVMAAALRRTSDPVMPPPDIHVAAPSMPLGVRP